jgi:crotonobetainyl-CoA:carnitine CoA-transferase CaiB-like acyl-CoA transferase
MLHHIGLWNVDYTQSNAVAGPLEGVRVLDLTSNFMGPYASQVIKPADLGVDIAPRIKTLKVSEPPSGSAGIKVPDVATPIDKCATLPR